MNMTVIISTLTIVSVIIGSGFISGKEIATFFSRFGTISFACTILAFAIYFFTIKLILIHASKILDRLFSSRLASISNLIISIVITSAMFAGLTKVLQFHFVFNLLILFIIIIGATFVFKRGLKALSKINLFFTGTSILIFSFLIFSRLGDNIVTLKNSIFAPIYSLLYVALNLSLSIVIIASIGKKLSSRQKTRVAFLSALVLCLLIFIVNIVLLQNQSLLGQDMPILSLFSGGARIVMQIIIFISCLTSIYSLVFSTSVSLRGLCKNEFINFGVSIILPLFIGLIGYGVIIDYVYPIISVLSVIVLIDLLFIPFFKRTNKKIHSSGKDTKKGDACHNDIKF